MTGSLLSCACVCYCSKRGACFCRKNLPLHTVYCRAHTASNAPVGVGVQLYTDMYNKHNIVSQPDLDCCFIPNQRYSAFMWILIKTRKSYLSKLICQAGNAGLCPAKTCRRFCYTLFYILGRQHSPLAVGYTSN